MEAPSPFVYDERLSCIFNLGYYIETFISFVYYIKYEKIEIKGKPGKV